jgi:regulator of sigma E protease
MTDEEKKVAFSFRPLLNKSLIVFAGPFANFVLAIFILTILFIFWGRSVVPPQVGELMPDGAAKEAGLMVGDVITEIDGETIKAFSDIQSIVSINRGTPIDFKVLRENKIIDVVVTPQITETKDVFGNKTVLGRIGVKPPDGEIRFEKLSPMQAVKASFTETYTICLRTMQALKQMITGQRSATELSGIIRIGKYAGQATEKGIAVSLWFTALLSINLGLINLFPIPMLDGGHLFFYGIEAVRGKPLNEKFQEYCLRFGMALLFALMGFAIFNDIRMELMP